MHIPRIGHEMIVDFPEGDPDRPIISTKVPICNMAWVRMGDSMAHGGVIVMGCPAVLIG